MKTLNNLFRFLSTITISLTLMFGSLSVAYADTPVNTNGSTYKASTVKSHYSDSDYVDGQEGSLMDILMMLASSMVTARLMVTCYQYPADVLIASAAAGIHIVGEIAEFATNSEGLESLDIDYKAGALTEAQRSALIKQSESYAKMIDALELKLTFEYAAAAAYLSAALTVFGLYAMYSGEKLACESSEEEAGTACAVEAAAICASSEGTKCDDVASCASCIAGVSSGIAAEEANDAAEATPMPSAAACTKKLSTSTSISGTKEATCSLGVLSSVVAGVVSGCFGVMKQAYISSYACCSPLYASAENIEPKQFYASKSPIGVDSKTKPYESATRFNSILKTEQMTKELQKLGYQNFLFVGNSGAQIIPPPVKKNNSLFHNYIDYREQVRVLNNENRSMNIDSYNQLSYQFQNIDAAYGKQASQVMLSSALESGLDLFMPRAEAGTNWLKALKIIGPMVATYLLIQAEIGVFIDQYISSPLIRGTMWAALAANMYSGATALETDIDELYSRIDTINDILTSLGYHVNDHSIKSGHSDTGEVNTYATGDSGPVSRPVMKDTVCIPTDKNKCDSISKKFNKAISKVKKSQHMPRNKSLEQARALASMLSDQLHADSANGQLSEATLESVKNLGDQGAVLKDLLKKQQDNINKNRKDHNKKPIDFSSMQKKFKSGLKNVATKALKSKGILPSQLYSGMYPNKAKSIEALKKLKSTEKTVKVAGKGKKKKVEKKKQKMISLDDLKDDELEKIDLPTDETTSEGELAKLDYKVNDIVKNKDVSIFKVLTTRYFSSVYPKIFKKKKKEVEEKK